jgi:4-aminobutyrate aminotransferase-like enzyme
MSVIDDILRETDPEKIRKETEYNYREYVNPFALRMFKNASLDIIETKREGACVWDVSGEKYIDCVTGAGIFNVGRHNTDIVEVLKKALDVYDMGGWISIIRERGLLARKLAEITPGDLKVSLFCCGGGEAIEVAVKLARGHTGRSEILCMENGYHGVTGFALPATGRDVYKTPFAPLAPGYRHVKFNDIDAVKEAMGEDTAAVLLEPVQGEGGIIPADDDYLRELRDLCNENGSLLIFDEVQTGFGRTGKMFCAEHSGVTLTSWSLPSPSQGEFIPSHALFSLRKSAISSSRILSLSSTPSAVPPWRASRPWRPLNISKRMTSPRGPGKWAKGLWAGSHPSAKSTLTWSWMCGERV